MAANRRPHHASRALSRPCHRYPDDCLRHAARAPARRPAPWRRCSPRQHPPALLPCPPALLPCLAALLPCLAAFLPCLAALLPSRLAFLPCCLPAFLPCCHCSP